jgi:hypothetical protein
MDIKHRRSGICAEFVFRQARTANQGYWLSWPVLELPQRKRQQGAQRHNREHTASKADEQEYCKRVRMTASQSSLKMFNINEPDAPSRPALQKPPLCRSKWSIEIWPDNQAVSPPHV